MIANAVEIAAGSLLLVATFYDLFQSVVLPRPAVGRVRLSPTLVRNLWSLWLPVATRPRRLQTREAMLAAFGPLMVVVLLLCWGLALVLGYALVLHGLRDQLHPAPGSFGTTFFFSVGTMLSFGVGGIEPNGAATRVLVGFEAATGFVLFALVISLLFALFGAFQRRETAVVALDALAGAPPTGIQMLETSARYTMPQQLAATFLEWRTWTVDVLESHLSYPLLMYFRSSHDNEAWPNSFGAVMDAAALVLTTIEDGPEGPAHLMIKVGNHLIEDLGRYFRYTGERVAGVERDEFAGAWARLRDAGYRMRPEETAWEDFTRLRAAYAPSLNRLTRRLFMPPASWIGDRSYLPHRDGPPAPRRPRRRGRHRKSAPPAGTASS
jgi:Ion channel